MSFSEMFKSAKTKDERETIPDGKYKVVLSNAKFLVAKSGKEMMITEWIISNPGKDGDKQKLAKFYMFDEMGLGNLKTDLATLNRQINPQDETECVQMVYDLCPLAAEGFVQSKKDKNGIMRTNLYINGPWEDDVESDDFTF